MDKSSQHLDFLIQQTSFKLFEIIGLFLITILSNDFTMSEARNWFKQNYKNDTNKIYTSKYYRPEESWPKTEVWWLQFPLTAIDMNKYDYVNFICQVFPDKNDFFYLKVPTEFLRKHLDKFHRIGEKVDIYLSARPENLFVELRGIGKLNFGRFLQ